MKPREEGVVVGGPATAGLLASADRLIRQSRWQEAIVLLAPLADGAYGAGDWATMASACIRIGRAESRMMRHAAAAQALQRALIAAGRLDDPGVKIDVIRNLGVVHDRAGDHEVAREFLGEARRLAEESGGHDQVGGILLELGNLDYEEQNFPGAARLYAGALAVPQTTEDRARALHNRAMVRIDERRPLEARQPAEELCALLEKEDSFPHLRAAGLCLLGTVRAAEGAPGEGLRLVNDSIGRHRGMMNGIGMMNALFARAMILEQLGRYPEASVSFREAHAEAVAKDSPSDQGRAALGLARVARAQGDDASARRWATAALEVAERGGSTGLAREARELLGVPGAAGPPE